MKWFEGSIAEAVTLSKKRNSIFVVYVEGNDELSVKLRRFIEEDRIRSKLETDNFVAIRIDSGSESYMQFAQIYQLVPLPSIFFIGKNGAPIQIVTGIISNSDALEQKINAVLETIGIKEATTPSQLENGPTDIPIATTSTASAASQSFIASEQSNPDVICEGGVCYRRPKKEEPATTKPPPSSSEVDPNTSMTPPPPGNLESNSTRELNSQPPVASTNITETRPADDIAAKLEKAKQLIEEKRKEKEEEEKRLERDREMRRRKEGREMLTSQKLQKEQELQLLKENIRREKQEENAARQRILEKIAADRAEQAQKFPPASTEKSTTEPSTSQTIQLPKPNAANSLEFSRIQFRKPEGETSSHTFKSCEQFLAVRDYVRISILSDSGIKDFSLATTFPRREFTTIDDTKSLLDLGLCPSAVLLVIAGQRSANSPSAIVARSGGVVNMFNTIFWGLLTPFFAAFGYIRSFFTGRRPDRSTTGAQKRSNEENMADNDAAKRRNIDRLLNQQFVKDEPSTSNIDKSKKEGSYRRVAGSNIHRLRENKDSDDENNTWNGNSTQQQ